MERVKTKKQKKIRTAFAFPTIFSAQQGIPRLQNHPHHHPRFPPSNPKSSLLPCLKSKISTATKISFEMNTVAFKPLQIGTEGSELGSQHHRDEVWRERKSFPLSINFFLKNSELENKITPHSYFTTVGVVTAASFRTICFKTSKKYQKKKITCERKRLCPSSIFTL